MRLPRHARRRWEYDEFPDHYRDLIEPANIVVLATPIWLGDQSCMTRLAIECLYGRWLTNRPARNNSPRW